MIFAGPKEWHARAARYGTEINSVDWLKFIALVIMTIDHVGEYLMVSDPYWWKAVGRVTFPAWFFLAGYAQSRVIAGEILWLGLVLAVVNYVTGAGIFPLNALITIVACRYMVQQLRERGLLQTHLHQIFISCVSLAIPSIIFCEYGTLALCFAIMGDRVRHQAHSTQLATFTVLSTMLFLGVQLLNYPFTIWQHMVMVVGTVITVAYMYRFPMKPSSVSLRRFAYANYIVRLLARNTMHYYVIHRMVFQLLGLALGFTSFDPARIIGM